MMIDFSVFLMDRSDLRSKVADSWATSHVPGTIVV